MHSMIFFGLFLSIFGVCLSQTVVINPLDTSTEFHTVIDAAPGSNSLKEHLESIVQLDNGANAINQPELKPILDSPDHIEPNENNDLKPDATGYYGYGAYRPPYNSATGYYGAYRPSYNSYYGYPSYSNYWPYGNYYNQPYYPNYYNQPYYNNYYRRNNYYPGNYNPYNSYRRPFSSFYY